MGQWSWLTQDTDTQIGSEPENTISVTMFDNKGNKWVENEYEGYGVFGGKDYYELLAEMNGVYNERSFGIELAFDETKKGTILYPALYQDSDFFNINEHNFNIEAENDPNQSWYVEEGYVEDDYEDED
jgi:hypothetical protein